MLTGGSDPVSIVLNDLSLCCTENTCIYKIAHDSHLSKSICMFVNMHVCLLTCNTDVD